MIRLVEAVFAISISVGVILEKYGIFEKKSIEILLNDLLYILFDSSEHRMCDRIKTYG